MTAADKGAQTGAEDGQGQACRILIGREGDGHQCEEHRHQDAGDDRSNYADRQAAAGHCSDEADNRAHQHHAFLTQVEHTGSLTYQFTQCRQQQRCAGDNSSGHNIGDQQRIHFRPPALCLAPANAAASGSE